MSKADVYEKVLEGLDVDYEEIEEIGLEGYDAFRKDLMGKVNKVIHLVSLEFNNDEEGLYYKDKKLLEKTFCLFYVLSEGIKSFEYTEFWDVRGISEDIDFLYRVCVYIESFIEWEEISYYGDVLDIIGDIKKMLLGKGELREGY